MPIRRSIQGESSIPNAKSQNPKSHVPNLKRLVTRPKSKVQVIDRPPVNRSAGWP
jgi:hypothetical protein